MKLFKQLTSKLTGGNKTYRSDYKVVENFPQRSLPSFTSLAFDDDGL